MSLKTTLPDQSISSESASCIFMVSNTYSIPSTVLNLPTTASGEEIRDRYRNLSLVYHPDKQRDPSLRETATQRFLEVQKAYEGAYLKPVNGMQLTLLQSCRTLSLGRSYWMTLWRKGLMEPQTGI